MNGAAAAITELKHTFLPQLSVNEQLNVGTNNSITGSYLPMGSSFNPSINGGIRPENVFQPATGNIGAVYGQYDLTTFGLRRAQLNQARANLDLQRADLQQEQYRLSITVSRLYFDLIKNRYKLRADEENIKRYQDIATVIHALTTSGLKAGSDSAQANAELAQSRIRYNQTRKSLQDLNDEMIYLTGIPAAQMVIDTLQRAGQIDIPSLANEVTDTFDNPLIRYYRKNQDLLLSREKVIHKSYLPKVLVAASAWGRGSSLDPVTDSNDPLYKGLGLQRYNYMAGLAVTYNLFNGIYNRDRLRVSHFETQAGAYALEQQKLQLRLTVRQADNALQTVRDNLKQLRIQLKSAEDTYQQKKAQYKAGIISLIDLDNASFVLYRSQTDYVEALGDQYLAQLSKAAATGQLQPFIDSLK